MELYNLVAKKRCITFFEVGYDFSGYFSEPEKDEKSKILITNKNLLIRLNNYYIWKSERGRERRGRVEGEGGRGRKW